MNLVPEPDAELIATAQQLAHRLDAGTESLTAVLAQLTELRTQQKWSVRAILGSYGVWLFDIVLIIVSVIILTGITQRLESSIHETCTLYGFIIPSYRETSRAASPMGPEGYDNFYRQMQVSADNLNCGVPHRI